jgi:hypothetical protein
VVSRVIPGGGACPASPRTTMRRLTRKRRKDDPTWPSPAPTPRPVATALRVKQDFACRGFTFYKGALLSPDDPLVREIAQEHPDYLERAT